MAAAVLGLHARHADAANGGNVEKTSAMRRCVRQVIHGVHKVAHLRQMRTVNLLNNRGHCKNAAKRRIAVRLKTVAERHETDCDESFAIASIYNEFQIFPTLTQKKAIFRFYGRQLQNHLAGGFPSARKPSRSAMTTIGMRTVQLPQW